MSMKSFLNDEEPRKLLHRRVPRSQNPTHLGIK